MTENRNTPFQIGKVNIPGRVIFAPMAGVSDLPFRLLCREQGAALVCMEMISAKAITYKNVRTAELMETSPEEAPVSLQLFGCEPEIIFWTSIWDVLCTRSLRTGRAPLS